MTGVVDQPALAQAEAPAGPTTTRAVGSPSSARPARSAPRPSTCSDPARTASSSARSAPPARSSSSPPRRTSSAPRSSRSPTARLQRRLAELLPAGIELRAGPEALCLARRDRRRRAERRRRLRRPRSDRRGPARRDAASPSRTRSRSSPARRSSSAPATVEGAELVPVDSEHGAIHQCLACGRPEAVSRLVLTASGGPFRGRTAAELASVTVADALAHPTWQMGPKITSTPRRS